MEKLNKTLNTLQIDVFDSTLGTHKLHGNMGDFYACKINYDYRIIFNFTDTEIVLHSIGTHDEVY